MFLESILLRAEPLTPSESRALGDTYSLATTKNVEISARYYSIGLRAKDSTVYESTTKLLGQVGRMKFVRPLYRYLAEVDKALAVKTFEKNSAFYHPICRALVAKDLEKNNDQ